MQIGIGSATIQLGFRDNWGLLKKYAMIFDQLHIIDLTATLRSAGLLLDPALSNDLWHLQNRGFLRDAILPSQEKSIFKMTEEQLNEYDFLKDNYDLKKTIIEIGNAEINFLRQTQFPEGGLWCRGVKYLPEQVLRSMPGKAAFSSRIHALFLRNLLGTNAISMEYFWESGSRSIDRNATEADLYEIVIKGWPMPSDIIPWDDIFAFRSEAASQQQLRALRLWVADMAKGKLTIAEASEKIEYLKQEYLSHMKGSNIQMGTSVLRTVIVGMAGFIENAVKLKLKELAEAPFELFDAKAKLVDAERKAPGRELAFVVRVENKLSSV